MRKLPLMRSIQALTVVLCSFAAIASAQTASDQPSRKAFEGCKWEKLRDANAGLEAWVMRCSGKVKSDFAMDGSKLMMRVPGEAPFWVVQVIDLRPGETAKQGLRRFFDAHTAKALGARCLLAPYTEGEKPPPGVTRYTFVADAALKKELEAKNPPGDIPDPPCGDFGDQPDFVQYYEVHEGARRVLLVNAGQDDPLFDEKTLRILPPKGK